jgi:Domain of unknown function (DUF4164)
MNEAKKFDAALTRFELALGLVENALKNKRDAQARLATLEEQSATLQSDRKRLDSDLALVRVKAAELVDTSKQAAGKIDSAVSRIRSVLYSNSGA